ncbi:MAG: response regulator transcription factor [Dorea sp.]|jgi:two-component system response regulator VicR|nr:response regulator transcription factor [Dorea sp.]
MAEILVVEDDAGLNRGITLTLVKEGYSVDSASCIKEANELIKKKRYDLTICDIMLPDGSGLEFGAGMRKTTNGYLIYLTAMDTEADMVNGYEAGADDYLTKPFSLMVLVSKVAALMRRMGRHAPERLYSGDIMVSLKDMNVWKDGQSVSLSKRELQLLIYLMEHAGRIMTKENITEHIWEGDGQFLDENTVPVNISRLKHKLGTNAIGNVRGLGYLWTEKVDRK